MYFLSKCQYITSNHITVHHTIYFISDQCTEPPWSKDVSLVQMRNSGTEIVYPTVAAGWLGHASQAWYEGWSAWPLVKAPCPADNSEPEVKVISLQKIFWGLGRLLVASLALRRPIQRPLPSSSPLKKLRRAALEWQCRMQLRAGRV